MVFCPHCGARMDNTSGICLCCRDGTFPPARLACAPQGEKAPARPGTRREPIIFPGLIKILYVMGIAVVMLAAFIFVVSSLLAGEAPLLIGELNLILVIFILLITFLRIYLELAAVFLHTLTEVREHHKR